MKLFMQCNAFLCSWVTVYHRNDLLLCLSPPKSMSSKFLTHTENKLQYCMQLQHVRMSRDPTVIWSLLSREPLQIPTKSSYCQKLHGKIGGYSILQLCAHSLSLGTSFQLLAAWASLLRCSDLPTENALWGEKLRQNRESNHRIVHDP